MATPKIFGEIESEMDGVKVSMYRDRNGELYIEITDQQLKDVYVDVNDHALFAREDGYGTGTWDTKMKGEDW